MSAVVSSSPDIPDEAVEAAARAAYEYTRESRRPNLPPWEDAPVSVRWGYFDKARAALAAAYPALTRQAVEDERERIRLALRTGMHTYYAGEDFIRLGYVLDVLDARIARTGGTP